MASSTDMHPRLPDEKPFIIGLYGIPGSGKTFLCNALRSQVNPRTCAFFEGSAVLDSIVPGGIDAFKELGEQDKAVWRGKAIDTIADECRRHRAIGIVTGHFMFWDEDQENGTEVWTARDQQTYCHIIYLAQPPQLVVKHRQQDTDRDRASITAAHVGRWQHAEQRRLLQISHDHRIGFTAVPCSKAALDKITQMASFMSRSPDQNMAIVRNALDRAILSSAADTNIALVLDADRTLAPQDSSVLLCDTSGHMDPGLLRRHFDAHGYSHRAFQLATALYEQHLGDDMFECFCQVAAARVTLYPDVLRFLAQAKACPRISIFVVTCGLRRVWEMVLLWEGLSDRVTLIGGGRFVDGLAVTPEVKADLVARLRHTHGSVVYAFGDSPLDLGMLRQANRAVVVVGDEKTRSKTMDRALAAAIDRGLDARQVILGSDSANSSSSARLDTARLPETTLPDELGDMLQASSSLGSLAAAVPVAAYSPRFLHVTERESCKLLTTPTRDAGISGPALREHHRRVGFYLAMELVAKVIGLEAIPVPHVQGHMTQGHRLEHEPRTAIVAIMRGGEPMASGVSDAFPRAMFVHADAADDVTPQHMEGTSAVILVDSVINSGRTIADFVARVRGLSKAVPVVVVAGVVQADSVAPGGAMARMLADEVNAWLVALRVSETSFTGSRASDTGNRLFNTTHMD